MPTAQKVRQPRSFARFRCTGSACEDTCCEGWGVNVDRATFEKYQDPLAPQVGGRALAGLVEINPAGTSSVNYARIRMDGIRCPALQEGLCSVHQTLGESYISDLCSSFPRVLNLTGDVMERSLHLSCPEAARMVLLDPDAMAFEELMDDGQPWRSGSLTSLPDSTSGDLLHQVRALVIAVIQERSRPLWQRIVSLGFAVEMLAGMDLACAVTAMEEHLSKFRAGFFDEILNRQQADPVLQLETVLELIVVRLGVDYTSPRFLQCYRELMQGLEWTDQSTMQELATRYNEAADDYFLPFISRHQHVLENYLVNHVFRTLFPYRRRQPDQSFVFDSGRAPMQDAFLLLGMHYAMIRTLLIGVAALHRHNLNSDHVIQLVQSYSRAFQHIVSFETLALESLNKKPEHFIRKIAVLVMDSPKPR